MSLAQRAGWGGEEFIRAVPAAHPAPSRTPLRGPRADPPPRGEGDESSGGERRRRSCYHPRMSYIPPLPDPSAPPVRINLLSDTQTRPTAAMREAMARAEVGDEQTGDDPTVNALNERVAALLGKEAAVFMPSGTMCNVTATLATCRPGDEIIAHRTAHILSREGGAHAALGGFQITPLDGDDGQFSLAAFRAALHPRSRYEPPQTMVSVEQTANIGGGTIWPQPTLDAIAAAGKAAGLATHMDGARLMNAAVATGIAAHEMAAGWDSVWIDFSKGLGAPVGAVAGGLARLHRRGVALEAAARRLDAAVRRDRRRLQLRARSSRRSAGGGSRQRPRAGRRPGADRRRRGAGAADQSGVLPPRQRRRPRRRDGRSAAHGTACCWR